MTVRQKVKKTSFKLERVALPVTREGFAELHGEAKRSEMSLGRWIVEVLEQQTGKKFLPDELRETE